MKGLLSRLYCGSYTQGLRFSLTQLEHCLIVLVLRLLQRTYYEFVVQLRGEFIHLGGGVPQLLLLDTHSRDITETVFRVDYAWSTSVW